MACTKQVAFHKVIKGGMFMKMKKLLSLALASVMVLSLAACGGGGSTASSGSGSDSGSSGNVCKYCGQVHTGTFGWLIQLFHTILAFFKR